MKKEELCIAEWWTGWEIHHSQKTQSVFKFLGVKTLFSEIKDLGTEVPGIATKSQDFLNSEKDEISISEFLKKGLF